MILSSWARYYLAYLTLFSAAANPPEPNFDLTKNAVRVEQFSFEKDEDLDYDGQPDDWSRRQGPEFPKYVEVEIDRKQGFHGTRSLRFNVNGGQVAYYSKVIEIDTMFRPRLMARRAMRATSGYRICCSLRSARDRPRAAASARSTNRRLPRFAVSSISSKTQAGQQRSQPTGGRRIVPPGRCARDTRRPAIRPTKRRSAARLPRR